ncbi:hypothetical protein [Vibrio paucivorans]|uniref:Uncharacterized protein n=1 Tax=Vibrio paucivorans TaxID=2829489 RepID=A0A9X3CEU7_9VIBR|nr:hypothetical protein [Vibrio paucivorans]MCW8333620.1 hypothetical protein [Vibrio paucivorans]
MKWATLNKVNRFTLLIFYFLWVGRVILAISSPFNGLMPGFGDGNLFASVISNNTYYPEQSIGFKLYYFASYPIRFLSGFNMINYFIIQAFAYFSGALIIWRAYLNYWNMKFGERNQSFSFVVYLLLVSLYPASIIYGIVPLREYAIIFSICVLVYSIISLQLRMKGSWLIIILSSVLIFLVRPQLIITIPMIVYLSIYNEKIKYYIPLIVLPFIMIKMFSLIYYPISPEVLSNIRQQWSTLHPVEVYGVYEWQSWLEVILSLPTLIGQYILSPFPILHNKPMSTMYGATLDLIYIVVLVGVPCLMLLVSKYRRFIPVSVVMLFIVLTGLSAVWEAYISGAVRHRMVSILPLLPFCAIMFTQLLRKSQ